MPTSARTMSKYPELHLAVASMLEFPGNVMLKSASRYLHDLMKPPSLKQLVDE